MIDFRELVLLYYNNQTKKIPKELPSNTKEIINEIDQYLQLQFDFCFKCLKTINRLEFSHQGCKCK